MVSYYPDAVKFPTNATIRRCSFSTNLSGNDSNNADKNKFFCASSPFSVRGQPSVVGWFRCVEIDGMCLFTPYYSPLFPLIMSAPPFTAALFREGFPTKKDSPCPIHGDIQLYAFLGRMTGQLTCHHYFIEWFERCMIIDFGAYLRGTASWLEQP